MISGRSSTSIPKQMAFGLSFGLAIAWLVNGCPHFGAAGPADGYQVSKTCDPIQVVRCYMTELDDWAWNLWQIRENIAALNATSCSIYENLKKCVKTDGCNEIDAIELSKVVTDLLHHTKHAGTFLRSYYAVSFACSPKGQEILKANKDCLAKWNLGTVILVRVKSLWAQYNYHFERPDPHALIKDDDRKAACEWVRENVDDLILNVKDDCAVDGVPNEEAGTFVCKSIVGPFRHLLRNMFHDCVICDSDSEDKIASPHTLKKDASATRVASAFVVMLLSTLLRAL